LYVQQTWASLLCLCCCCLRSLQECMRARRAGGGAFLFRVLGGLQEGRSDSMPGLLGLIVAVSVHAAGEDGRLPIPPAHPPTHVLLWLLPLPSPPPMLHHPLSLPSSPHPWESGGGGGRVGPPPSAAAAASKSSFLPGSWRRFVSRSLLSSSSSTVLRRPPSSSVLVPLRHSEANSGQADGGRGVKLASQSEC
jgi:hypothetical protein